LKNLVTFNGKAFDWPRVKTRHRFVRDQVPRLPSFGHFDLLHASRRLWKDRLPSIRLQIVEQEILGIKRAGDVPGKMAPFLYFKFLKHPDAALVRGIIEHNREDVRSLIALYIHLSGTVLGTIPSDDREQFEVARWYMQLGETPRALERFEKLAKHHSRIGEMAKTYVGKLYKKEGRYDQALAIYRELIDRRHLPDDEACVEAAKLMEHHYKNNEQALKYTLLAIQYLRKKERISADARCKREHAYWRRANRLDEKLMGQKGRQRNLNKARNG
jgi:pentatricopeptide repeat protein